MTGTLYCIAVSIKDFGEQKHIRFIATVGKAILEIVMRFPII